MIEYTERAISGWLNYLIEYNASEYTRRKVSGSFNTYSGNMVNFFINNDRKTCIQLQQPILSSDKILHLLIEI